jgi:hypothetical protein
MKNIIAAAVITAGLCIPLSYLSGALLTRTARNELDRLRADLQSTKESLIRFQREWAEENSKNFSLQQEVDLLKIRLKNSGDAVVYLAEENDRLKKNALYPTEGTKDQKYTCGDFVFYGVIFTNSEYAGHRVRGIVENISSQKCDAQFEISIFDDKGVVMAVETLSIHSFEAGQKRAFAETISVSDWKKIGAWKINLSSLY